MIRRNFLKAMALVPFVPIPVKIAKAGTLNLKNGNSIAYWRNYCLDQRFHYFSKQYPGNLGVVITKTYDVCEEMFHEFAKYSGEKSNFLQKSVTYANGSVVIFSNSKNAWNEFNSMNLGWFYLPQDSELNRLASKMRTRLRRKGFPHSRLIEQGCITWN